MRLGSDGLSRPHTRGARVGKFGEGPPRKRGDRQSVYCARRGWEGYVLALTVHDTTVCGGCITDGE
jgi:hypothetical protein